MLKLTERLLLLLLLLEEVVVDEECVMLTSGGGVNGGKPTIPVVEGWDTATASVEGITVERCGVDIGIADVVVVVDQGGGGMPRDVVAIVLALAALAALAALSEMVSDGEFLMGVAEEQVARYEGTGLVRRELFPPLPVVVVATEPEP
jgi:hypothetical protein